LKSRSGFSETAPWSFCIIMRHGDAGQLAGPRPRVGLRVSRAGDAPGVAFRRWQRRRHPGFSLLSRLNAQPARSPVNACQAALRRPSHDSGASVTRYVFTVRDFHSLHLAGLSRRSCYPNGRVSLASCGRAAFSNVKAVYEEYKNDPRLVVIGMDLDPRAEDAMKYISENGMGWVHVFLGDWNKTGVPDQYGIRSIPTLILLGPKGEVLAMGATR